MCGLCLIPATEASTRMPDVYVLRWNYETKGKHPTENKSVFRRHRNRYLEKVTGSVKHSRKHEILAAGYVLISVLIRIISLIFLVSCT